MPYATATTTTFGDGADAASSTETGTLTRDLSDGSFTLKPVGSGFTHPYLAVDEAPLRDALQAAVAAYDAFIAGTPGGARQWDVSNDVADNDDKVVSLQENSGTITMTTAGTGAPNIFKIDTIRGLLLAL